MHFLDKQGEPGFAAVSVPFVDQTIRGGFIKLDSYIAKKRQSLFFVCLSPDSFDGHTKLRAIGPVSQPLFCGSLNSFLTRFMIWHYNFPFQYNKTCSANYSQATKDSQPVENVNL